MRPFLIAVFAATLVAACSERPSRPDPEHAPALNLLQGPDAMGERTLEQGESERMGH